MGQILSKCVCGSVDHTDQEFSDQPSCLSVENSEYIQGQFKIAVECGNVGEVSKLIETGKCDVNKCGKYEVSVRVADTFPLLFSLKKIETKNDEFYQISKVTYWRINDIDVNKEGLFSTTLLGELCRN